MLFQSYVGRCDARTLAWARLVHDRVFGAMPLSWARKGTCIEAWNGRRRVAFAPHRGSVTIYFRGPQPVQRYRGWGGGCPTGKICIRVPVGSDFEAPLLRQVVAEYLGLSGCVALPDVLQDRNRTNASRQPVRRQRGGTTSCE